MASCFQSTYIPSSDNCKMLLILFTPANKHCPVIKLMLLLYSVTSAGLVVFHTMLHTIARANV